VKKLGKKAENCIVVENAILGLQSAIAAGCRTYALETTLNKEDLVLAEEVFSNHKDLLTKFENQL
jgi:beta-phosphoglucomutase-like phosphatase (HAD superfamily)